MSKLIFVGNHYSIEPLGIIYLLGIAVEAGWETRLVLVSESNFSEVFSEINRDKPNLVAFSIWTGGHLAAFEAAAKIKGMDIPVAIGGPHATYFADECRNVASWVVRHTGFNIFRKILETKCAPGVYFDSDRSQEFPAPARKQVYLYYPEYARSPIKSMIASVGCPYQCTYCYAPKANLDHGGFELNIRKIDDLIREGQEIKDNWPETKLIYFVDDVFGFDTTWLTEFVERWKSEVGLPWHCQIRIELTRDERRLYLFKKGGCTGITLAIESGSDFLRRYVLRRGMPHDLIVEGCRKIQSRGLRLRTEQILAVPFSDIKTDIATLKLNCEIAPDMAWTSILAPYLGTEMGSISSRFGFYNGNNDDLSETFFSRSVLQHVEGGPAAIEEVTRKLTKDSRDNPLLRMTVKSNENNSADVYHDLSHVAKIKYLDTAANNRYADQTVMLHQLFYVLARIPEGYKLGEDITALPSNEWTWGNIGRAFERHLMHCGYASDMIYWYNNLVKEYGGLIPPDIEGNVWYFVFLPGAASFIRKLCKAGIFSYPNGSVFWEKLATLTRHHLFETVLYLTEESTPQTAGIII